MTTDQELVNIGLLPNPDGENLAAASFPTVPDQLTEPLFDTIRDLGRGSTRAKNAPRC